MSNLLGILTTLMVILGGTAWYITQETKTNTSTTTTTSSASASTVASAVDTKTAAANPISIQGSVSTARVESVKQSMLYPNQYFDTKSKAQVLLLAEVSAPTYNKKQLFASDIYITKRDKKTYAYVAYNRRGADFMGAVQVLELDENRPKLLQTVVFKDTDIHNLTIKQDWIYLAGASGDAKFKTPAVLEVRALKNHLIDTSDEGLRVDLPSYAATSVLRIKNQVVVAVGALYGGIAIIDNKLINGKTGILQLNQKQLQFFDLPDARSLSFDKDYIYALRGTDAALWKLRRSSMQDPDLIQLEGATIAEAKSTIQVSRDLALLGLSDGGASVLDLKSNKVIAHFPMPRVANLDEELTTTNAVSGSDTRMVTADGEAGSSMYQKDAKGNYRKMASLRFNPGISVNAVSYYRGLMVMASGAGGIKIAKLIKLSQDSEAHFFDELDALRDSEY